MTAHMNAPYQLVFTERYTRVAAKFLKRHPDMARAYEKKLELLALNPHHPSLRLHALSGRLADLHSVSINLSYRITLHFQITEREIVPINVGDHDDVY
jgi:toxin HigB-1